MAKRQTHNANLEDEAVKRILSALLTEFKERELGASDLHNGYEGLVPANLKAACMADGAVSEVDYDLAMKSLLATAFVKTGPMVMPENDPNSGVLMLIFFSKNEFSYLTETGYRAATKLGFVKPQRPYSPHVNISGTFHNSPIGVGHNVSQTLNLNTATEEQLFTLLREETKKHIVEEQKRQEILTKVDQLEEAEKPTKMERYAELVGVLGDHITVFGFILPYLLQRIL